MGSKEEFLKKREQYIQKCSQLNQIVSLSEDKANHYQNEANRIFDLLDTPEKYISELSHEFKNRSTLNSVDYTFLFFATALQCVRWLCQPKVSLEFEKVASSQRHNAGTDGEKYDFSQSRKHSEKYNEIKKSHKYPDRKKILAYAVPYDAMKGTEHVFIPGVTELGKNLYGGNHHSATLGHDPILGYIFGTLNILTRTITYKNAALETNLVHLSRFTEGDLINKLNPKGQYVTNGNIGVSGLLERTCETLSEDIMRLPTALVKQHFHMQSDKYTKHGLPIPLVSAEKAQLLLEGGWNSYELERLAKHIAKNTGIIGIQALLSILINTIIETLYRLLDTEEDAKIKEVKARKIIMYSNTLATTSNVIYSLVTENVNNLDLGGLLITIYRIASDSRIIDQIKEEYIFGSYERQLQLREFTI